MQKEIIAKLQHSRQTRHHRDADARVDGPQPEADKGGGLRRGKLCPRQDGRSDAFGRGGGRQLSGGVGEDDVIHRGGSGENDISSRITILLAKRYRE